ncbi:DUF3243 domain-containing protein [Brevibacterium sp. JNUCC-42]|uniref:DUF3243 domain-containing protein n=1 Tax=Brevibacillus laterosporus TaxID=1465 RepID=A0A502IM20_BRELA|nr:DUF3243 domain-containing protein [Brevibacillus laterosporus]QOS99760.1 DUF3243 domain-containing protein [Brevibacterium sp. JNUCC-42]QDX94916.1 DUF3243 domain-containing protein [Brevibacillus laterosporus]RAP30039.1 hypothetical protein C2W64_02594 [Brevibacillus laterosporus]TPG68785.1 DUF3243 domain-containing protein [Brevibacillus laterosporus]TPG87901.1 DUF3243 domain-containing protein [Brevibacillus laterosporus]
MSVLDNFGDWKGFLSERVQQATQAGMNSDTIQNVAYQIGGYLADQVDPKNEQERLLKQLWDAGDDEQRRAIASVMVKIVSDGQKE